MKSKDGKAEIKWFNTVFYPQRKTARAVRYEDGVLPRLRKEKITFFTPWGPRYKWETRGTIIRVGDKEVDVLHFLREILEECKRNMKEKTFRWVFLGADLYGNRINNLPNGITERYFESLADWIAEIIPEAEFILWSKFDQGAEIYRKKICNEFNRYADMGLLNRAIKTAHSMGNQGCSKKYLIERISEAMLVEELFEPIKISCAPRHKDDKVDYMLPRLYFLPKHLNAPWL